MNGATQGVIAGEVTVQGRQGKFCASAVNYEIKSATTFSSGGGSVVGKPQPGSFRITRNQGPGSTQLFHAMVTSELLKEVRVDFYRTGPTGAEILSQTFRLLNARLVSYTRVHHSEPGSFGSTDVLEFLSPTIEVIDVEKNMLSSFSLL